MKKIIPIHHNHNHHLFCEHTPTWQVQRGYDRLVTNYLKAGVEINLLSIGETQRLLDTGIMDCTDSLDPHLNIDAIVLKITKDGVSNIYVHDAQNEPLTTFAYPSNGNYRQMQLDYVGTVKFFSDDLRSVSTVVVKLSGICNLELGNLSVTGKVLPSLLPEDYADSIEVVGFSIAAYRTNHNHVLA